MRRPSLPRRAALLAALLAALPPLASAAGGRLLSWQDCVDLALLRNPALASSRQSVEQKRADYKGSYNGLLPAASLSNSYSDSNASGPQKWSGQLSANVQLFNAGKIADVKSASAALGQSEAALRQESAGLRFSLRQAFVEVLFSQEDIEVSRRVRDLRERDAKLVALRYDSGRESKGSMMRAKAQLLQAQADLDQAFRLLRSNEKALDRELGQDEFEALAATGALAAATPPAAPEASLSLALRRPDVAAQEALVSGARASLSVARSALVPTLSGSYSRGRSGESEFPSGGSSWSAGLSLSYPLFGGGPTAAYYGIQSAQRALEAARQNLRAAREAAVADIESAWASYAGAVDQVAVERALLEAARQRNDEADVRYASGLLSYDEWEIIASDRISTERQAISAELNSALAQAAWQKAVGKELGE
ncbi:MAG: TolC family protein [Elusimicrobia bacterium]|nr:TolC family protein [Elusimicrobiota bacterium]MDE2236435.1 TolC family protein [Elusimicrobiota bacterium]MDE2426405.1 TolC family protein [Elusimicrobiota bacterium]